MSGNEEGHGDEVVTRRAVDDGGNEGAVDEVVTKEAAVDEVVTRRW